MVIDENSNTSLKRMENYTNWNNIAVELLAQGKRRFVSNYLITGIITVKKQNGGRLYENYSADSRHIDSRFNAKPTNRYGLFARKTYFVTIILAFMAFYFVNGKSQVPVFRSR